MAIVGKVLNSFNNCPVFIKKGLKKAVDDPISSAGFMTVLSVVSKDFIQCFFYTYQSWNNKNIPPAKRKFIACSDVTNCVLMVGGQLLVYKGIQNKFQPWLTGKLFKGEYENKNTRKTSRVMGNVPFKQRFFSQIYHPDTIREYTLEYLKKNYKTLTGTQMEDIAALTMKRCAKNAKSAQIVAGLGLIVAWLGTNALVKRTLAPLLSIPSAAWLEKKIIKMQQNKEARKKGIPVYSRQGVIV